MRTFSLAFPLLVAVVALAPIALATQYEIDIDDFEYRPARFYANAGDTARWTNHDGAPHTVTCEATVCTELDSPFFGMGQSWSFTFARGGTYEYFCRAHSGMNGDIFVGTGNAADANLAPDAATIAARRDALLPGTPIPHPSNAILSVEVANTGGAASAPVKVEFLVADATGALVVVATGDLPALAPGERATVEGGWTGAPLLGSDKVTVRVDTTNAVVEGDEVDNSAEKSIPVGLIPL